MRYTVDLKPRAMKDLRRVPQDDARRIFDALDDLQALRAAKAKESAAPTTPLAEARRKLRL
jgi:mRNA-degrading endonuclease RelE of RelBE toxin-antitoxin system